MRLKKTDPDKPRLQFYTYMRLILGDNGKKIIENLHAFYGDSCVGKTAVYRWIRKFPSEMTFKPG